MCVCIRSDQHYHDYHLLCHRHFVLGTEASTSNLAPQHHSDGWVRTPKTVIGCVTVGGSRGRCEQGRKAVTFMVHLPYGHFICIAGLPTAASWSYQLPIAQCIHAVLPTAHVTTPIGLTNSQSRSTCRWGWKEVENEPCYHTFMFGTRMSLGVLRRSRTTRYPSD